MLLLSIKNNFFSHFISKFSFTSNNILNKVFVFSFFLGVLTTFVFPPYGFIFFGFITFSIIFIFLHNSKNVVHTSLIVFFFIFGLFLSGTYWIYDAVYLISQKILWGILAVLFSSFIVAFFSSIIGGSYFYLKSKNLVYNAVLFGLLFSCIEFGREILLHFPWFPIALGFVKLPIVLQPIGIVGVHIYSILIYIFFLLPIFFFKNKFFGLFLICITIFIFLYGVYCQKIFTNKNQKTDNYFYLVQPNISQKRAMSENSEEVVFKRLQILNTIINNYPLRRNDLYVFPESYFSYITVEENNKIQFIKSKTNAIVGKTERMMGKNYNTMIFFQDSFSKIYKKNILVPFGEYIPIFNLWGYNPFGLAAGDEAGEFNFRGIKLFPLICYEIAFTAFNIESDSDYILTISEDSWYDGRTEKSQHFAYSILRAIEYRKPVVRVSTTGYSGLVDIYGNIAILLPNEKRAIVKVPAYARNNHSSLYGQYFAKVLKWLHLFLLFLFFAERGLKIEKKC